MRGICLRLFVSEAQRHEGKLLYEWLLEKARGLGIAGGTAIRAVAGYGRDGRMLEEAFFELAGDLPVEVEFLLSEDQSGQLLELLKTHKLRLFYTRQQAEYGVTE